MTNRTRFTFSLLAAALTVAAATGVVTARQTAQVQPADLVLRGGKIVTLDDAMPEVQALAARDGAIVAIGSNAEIARFVGAGTEVVELGGQLAIPGFIEGHGHFTGIGNAKLGLELLDTTSWEQIVQMVAQAVETARPGQWIVGRG